MAEDEEESSGNTRPSLRRQTGIGVDATGGPVIDPTKNVLDLVDAESRYQNGMREASDRLNRERVNHMDKFHGALRESESKIQNWMRDSEMKRITDLAALRQIYETTIADMLRTSVESTSSLVSTQLVQIQNTFNDRVSQLERFRYEQGGKSSISDPATAEALLKMTDAIRSLTKLRDQDEGSNRAHSTSQASMIAIAGVIAALIGAGVGYVAMRSNAGPGREPIWAPPLVVQPAPTK